jgi:hypothetical protein
VYVHWRKCIHDAWCAFETAVLPDANASGILLIWSESADQTIYIGEGGIAKGLKWARQFEPIRRRRDLFVTWATIPEDIQAAVRNYLYDRLHPVHSEHPTPGAQIPVNLPWERT